MSKGDSVNILVAFVFVSHESSERWGCDGRVVSQQTQPWKLARELMLSLDQWLSLFIKIGHLYQKAHTDRHSNTHFHYTNIFDSQNTTVIKILMVESRNEFINTDTTVHCRDELSPDCYVSCKLLVITVHAEQYVGITAPISDIVQISWLAYVDIPTWSNLNNHTGLTMVLYQQST